MDENPNKLVDLNPEYDVTDPRANIEWVRITYEEEEFWEFDWKAQNFYPRCDWPASQHWVKRFLRKRTGF